MLWNSGFFLTPGRIKAPLLSQLATSKAEKVPAHAVVFDRNREAERSFPWEQFCWRVSNFRRPPTAIPDRITDSHEAGFNSGSEFLLLLLLIIILLHFILFTYIKKSFFVTDCLYYKLCSDHLFLEFITYCDFMFSFDSTEREEMELIVSMLTRRGYTLWITDFNETLRIVNCFFYTKRWSNLLITPYNRTFYSVNHEVRFLTVYLKTSLSWILMKVRLLLSADHKMKLFFIIS